MFNESLSNITRLRLANDLKYGKLMLDTYRTNRDNMHIANVLDTLKTMDAICTLWLDEERRLTEKDDAL